MFIIWEIVNNNETIIIIIYCLIMLWINIDYLRGYKEINEGLAEISSEDELELNPNHISVILFVLMFNFIRRWLIYLLAVFVTEHPVVIIISAILFAASLYDTLFNSDLAKMKKSKIRVYLAIADAVFISIFVIYLLISL